MLDEAADRFAEVLPLARLGADSLGQPQAHKEPLLQRIALDAYRLPDAEIIVHGFGVLPTEPAIEGMGVAAKAGVRLQQPVFHVVPGCVARQREIGDFGKARDGHLVEVRGKVA